MGCLHAAESEFGGPVALGLANRFELLRGTPMNRPIPEEALAKVQEAILHGQKIEAIRLYREYTGAGLAEAKTAVERLEAELRAAEPDRFAVAAAGPGGSQPPIRLVAGVPLGCLVGAVPFVAFGAVLLAWGIRDGLSSCAFVARAERTEGAVVRLDNWFPNNWSPGMGGHSNTECRAAVSYQVGGEAYEVHGYSQKQPSVHGWPRGYQVGEVVGVLYDPDRPGEAMVDSFFGWGGALIPSVVGLTFLLLGLGLLRSERRKWRGRREGGGAEPSAAADGGA